MVACSEKFPSLWYIYSTVIVRTRTYLTIHCHLHSLQDFNVTGNDPGGGGGKGGGGEGEGGGEDEEWEDDGWGSIEAPPSPSSGADFFDTFEGSVGRKDRMDDPFERLGMGTNRRDANKHQPSPPPVAASLFSGGGGGEGGAGGGNEAAEEEPGWEDWGSDFSSKEPKVSLTTHIHTHTHTHTLSLTHTHTHTSFSSCS